MTEEATTPSPPAAGASEQFDILRSGALRDVPHGFFGSAGGRHQFGFHGPGDQDLIRTLRQKAAEAICPGAVIVGLQQIHSAETVTLIEAWRDDPDTLPRADGLATVRRGIALSVITADCAPILFADKDAGVIGAAHAGWRGAVGGVIENTIAAMEALGAKRESIAAAIGPTIAQPSYEVDASFRENFTAEDDTHFQTAPTRDGKLRWHFDLPGYTAARLSRCAIGKIDVTGQDTLAQPARYHSYRRATQEGAENFGRQISIIAQKP